jgi:hypothetical protein
VPFGTINQIQLVINDRIGKMAAREFPTSEIENIIDQEAN